ncbi:BCCT family transporter [Candidatus Spongiihabitans sp.]|uniref:BCCT family transporter n=1 Tax=Candidatus Spongiihabitans sp. TaxID=3101308 RepID=UPI003C7CD55F
MNNDTPSITAKSGFWAGMHPGMGLASKGMIVAFVVFTALNVDLAGNFYAAVRGWIEASLNWYYITAVTVMLFACFFLMFSRYGSIRLGDDDSRPEFRNFSWFAMLFSAGVGIGILFFGVAEPVFYFDNSAGFGYPNNPYADQIGATAMNEARAVAAMRVTYFHWGFHGWSVYVVVGLSLAYFAYRRKLPLTLRSALYPILGDKIYGPIGHAVDLLAVFGTVFGVATSLGLGVQQMAVGLNHLFGIDPGLVTQIVLIGVISVIATLSAVSGVGNGIRIISEWNIYLSIVLLAYFMFAGPFQWLMGFFVTTYGDYLWNVIPMGFQTFNSEGAAAWQGGWTIFYWGWWISWAPFVGMFIARISRGRTIREFMVGVMFVPTTIAFFWLCMFGGNAIYLELQAAAAGGSAGIAETVMAWDLPQALYSTIDQVSSIKWLSWAMAALATLLLATWFITSSDSGTLVITTMLSMGHDNPPKKFRIIWGMGEGLVAAVLLSVGGLKALQTASIAAALPVSIIMLLMTWGLFKSLATDPFITGKSAALEDAAET